VRQDWARLFLCFLLVSFGLLAQTSHRQPNPSPPREPGDIFDQLQKQQAESPKKQGQQALARQQRSANLAELERELPRLIDLAQGLQNRLRATNLETAHPADLEQQAKELEQVARRVHKRVRSL
jgi:hypothetical protein